MELHKLADLRPANAILQQGFLPVLCIGIERHPDKFHSFAMEMVIHPEHLRDVATAVGTPGSPEVEDNIFSTQLRELESLAVHSLHLEVRSLAARLHQIGGILTVEILRHRHGCIVPLILPLCGSPHRGQWRQQQQQGTESLRDHSLFVSCHCLFV